MQIGRAHSSLVPMVLEQTAHLGSLLKNWDEILTMLRRAF